MGEPGGRNKTEFGDFQTPEWLAQQVSLTLRDVGLMPKSLLDPTCGTGNLLRAGTKTFDSVTHLFGIDINGGHVERARNRLGAGTGRISADIRQGDFFSCDWRPFLRMMPDPLLILGNPPWVTNTELSALHSTNLPPKANLHGRPGIDALTGASNFDISESMLLKMIAWLNERPAALAMLCKTKVARKVLQYAWSQPQPPARCQLWRINAKRAFDASVDACLLIFDTTRRQAQPQCAVYDDLRAQRQSNVIGLRDGRLVADLDAYARWRHLRAGEREPPQYQWRSGIKHDCASAMELRTVDGRYVNLSGDDWELEPDYLYPMYKSSDLVRSPIRQSDHNGGEADRLARAPVTPPRRWMLATQKAVGESTAPIRTKAPNTWRYLHRHRDILDSRRSSVYRNRPRFAIFGVGAYAFARWKVAISGMYKQLRFVVVGPHQNKPVVFDDTCYFIPCHAHEEAHFVADLLNSEPALQFYRSFIFWNDKRPIAAGVLRRLSLFKLAQELHQEVQFLAYAR